MNFPKAKWNILVLVFLISFSGLLNNCQQNTSATDENQVAETEQTLEKTTDSAATDAATEEQEVQAIPAPKLADNFPADQQLEIAAEDMSGLCGNKYGCLEQTIVPLGWSRDGKFAYLLKEANEAVQNTTVHFYIQDMATDERTEHLTFKASEQEGYSEDTDDHTILSVWKHQEDTYRSLLDEYEIQLGQGTGFVKEADLSNITTVTFESRDKMRKNEMFAIKEVDQHWLVAIDGQGAEKQIAKQFMGKYDFVLKSKPLGVFMSPFEQKVAVLEGLERRGYEGPPNVLLLQLVGCDLSQGFK